ncbi:TetR/AcrR family transcriptional regulator [Arthrobacter sp. TMP15]|uniref:TetR/AcrR family transcriptional regulator n=1 Tax=Arthrobacter sp. TMP15 TaxID=3140789 RepID=UPI0031BA9FE1
METTTDGTQDPRNERTWHGTSKSARDAARRGRLLEAGLELFGTAGYAATTVQGLCREAGVSSRSFYDYFPSREELLRTVYIQATEQMRSRVAQLAFIEEASVQELLRRGVMAGVGPMLEDERLGRVCEIEAVGVSPALEQCRRTQNAQIAGAIEGLLAEIMRNGLVPAFDTTLVGLMVVGGMTEVLVSHLSIPAEQRRPAEELVAEMARVVGLMVVR